MDGQKFAVCPTSKSSSLLRPLDVSSGHVPHVHGSWPIAYVKRLDSLSNTFEGALQAREGFIRRLEDFAAPRLLIQRLRNVPVQCSVGRYVGDHEKRVALWCKLPYHPVWFREINVMVGKINRDKGLSFMYSLAFGGQMPILRIAWSNAIPPISNCISRI